MFVATVYIERWRNAMRLATSKRPTSRAKAARLLNPEGEDPREFPPRASSSAKHRVASGPAASKIDLQALLQNLLDAAERFHGSREAALRWLNTPNVALGGVTPLEAARTKAGIQAVLDLLAGLEHGVVQ
jgi:hypothetical protein